MADDITVDGSVNPIETPSAFYTALVGGVLLPGVIPPDGLEGWELLTDYEIKKGKGVDDATITDTGDPPPTGKIKTQIWRYGIAGDPNDFADLVSFNRMLRAARRAKKALDIVHPIVNAQEVTSVVVKSIGKLTAEGGGLYTVEYEFLKWVPQPKASGGTPSGSQDKDKTAPDGSTEKEDDPNADAKKELEKKIQEAQQPDDD